MPVDFSPGRVAKLSVKEQASSWGTPETTLTEFIECTEPDFDFPMEVHRPDTIRAGHWTPVGVPGSRKGGTLSFTIRLHCVDSTILSADPTEHLDAKLIKWALGASAIDGYEAGDDLTGTTVSAITTDVVGGYAAGQGVIVPPASGSDHLLGVVTTIAAGPPQVLTLLYKLHAAPTTDDPATVYGTNTIYPSIVQPTPLTFLLTGQATGQSWNFSDCLIEKCDIKVNPGGLLEAAFSVKVGTWAHDNGGTALANYSHVTDYLPTAIGRYGGRFGHYTGTTLTDYPCGDIALSISNTLAEVLSFQGNDGIDRYVRTDQQISFSATLPFTDFPVVATDMQDLPGEDFDVIRYQLGTTPGSMFGIVIPAASIESIKKVDVGGLMGLSLEIVPNEFADDTGSRDLTGATPVDQHIKVIFG
jgi:hypothetical protein